MASRTLVYLVDDDEMYLKTATHTLSQNRSFDLKTFSSGEAILEELNSKKRKPDVVVLDYFLNSENSSAISGLEVLKQLKKITTAEVIMLSGQENIDVAVNSVKYGAYDYVVKNKSAFIRVQNDIKRIAKVNRNTDENKKLKRFLIGLLGGVSFVGLYALLMTFDPTLFGLLGDDKPVKPATEQVDSDKSTEEQSSDEQDTQKSTDEEAVETDH